MNLKNNTKKKIIRKKNYSANCAARAKNSAFWAANCQFLSGMSNLQNLESR